MTTSRRQRRLNLLLFIAFFLSFFALFFSPSITAGIRKNLPSPVILHKTKVEYDSIVAFEKSQTTESSEEWKFIETKNELAVNSHPEFDPNVNIFENVTEGKITDKLLITEAKTTAKQIHIEAKTIGNEEKCEPKRHLVFVKTHKTASSAIQNMILRFGENNNLTIGFPPKMYLNQYVKIGEHFVYNDVSVTPGGSNKSEHVDILCFHAMANYSEMRKAVPFKDTVLFSIIRDPIAVFESLFEFLGYGNVYRMTYLEYINEITNNTMLKVLPKDHNNYFTFNMLKTLPDGATLNFSKKRHLWSWNPLTFDLGVQVTEFVNATNEKVEKIIEYIDSNLDFMMISDRMDESLVLLKEILCWSWKDMVIFKKNYRADHQKNPAIFGDPTLNETVRNWNFVDHRLYQHFNLKLDQRIQQYGIQRMAIDVQILQNITNDAMKNCVANTVNPKQAGKEGFVDDRLKEFAQGIMAYNLREEQKNNLTCLQLALPEISYLNRLRDIYGLDKRNRVKPNKVPIVPKKVGK